MLVPQKTAITQFVQKYFIEDSVGSQYLFDQKVRVLYFDEQGFDTKNKAIKVMYKMFDIYVRYDQVHTTGIDYLKNRYDLISQRLRYLMTRQYHIHNMHFEFRGSYNMISKVPGYKRLRAVFVYKRTV